MASAVARGEVARLRREVEDLRTTLRVLGSQGGSSSSLEDKCMDVVSCVSTDGGLCTPTSSDTEGYMDDRGGDNDDDDDVCETQLRVGRF